MALKDKYEIENSYDGMIYTVYFKGNSSPSMEDDTAITFNFESGTVLVIQEVELPLSDYLALTKKIYKMHRDFLLEERI